MKTLPPAEIGKHLERLKQRHWISALERLGLSILACLALLNTFTAKLAEAVSLQECIREALDRNPDVNAATSRVDAARAMITQARSAYYPQLSLSGGYTVTDNPTQAFMMQLNQRKLNMQDPTFDPNNPDTTDNIRLSAGLKYAVYDFGRRRFASQGAKLGLDSADLQLQAVRNELIHEVTRGFFGVLQAQDFVAVQQETIDSMEESLRVARARYAAGAAVKSDVLNLEVSLAQAREDLIRTRNGLDLAIVALNAGIGYDLVSLEEPPIAGDIVPAGPQTEQNFKAVENRPELQTMEKFAGIKEKQYLSIKRQHYPVLNAFGSYDLDGDGSNAFEGSFNVGVMAEWELFSGFRVSAAARNAEAQWRAALEDEKKVRNDLKLDLQRARIQAIESWQRLEVVRKAEESASESLRITKVRYREGAAGITDLLTAQLGLTASRNRKVAAFYDAIVSASNLQRARGELHSLYDSRN